MHARHLQSTRPSNSRLPRSSLSPVARRPRRRSRWVVEAQRVRRFSRRARTPDDPMQTVRALVAAHHADVANGTSEDNILTLMIDSNGNYVGSATSKGNVVARVAPSGENVATATASGARGAGGGGGAVIAAAPAGAVARGAGGGFATTASGETANSTSSGSAPSTPASCKTSSGRTMTPAKSARTRYASDS